MASTAVYDDLLAALRERLAVIGDTAARTQDPVAHLARLQDVSEKIVALAAKLPADTDPRLAHFLERCSYEKALEWMDHR